MKYDGFTELPTKQTATAYGKLVAGEVCTSLGVKSPPGSPEKGEEFIFGLSLLKIKVSNEMTCDKLQTHISY